METHGLVYLRESFVFLLSAGIVVPLLHLIRIPPVLSYLVIGGLIGPFGLGLFLNQAPWLSYLVISDLRGVQAIAEFGVIFLLFMIGLELSIDRLWAMRRLVFGLGTLQVLITAVCIGGVAWGFGNSAAASLVLGACLALSSTAIVMQLLVERHQLGSALGQSSFSILLLQDLAVVPLLFLVGILSKPNSTGIGQELLWSMMQALVVIVAIYITGRTLLRPLFHMVARSHNVEMFTATTLLTIIGAAAVTGAGGLSMALGAFLAGLLLAETEFRHEIEVTVEPVKGLLLGLFFMSVGMSLDLRIVAQETFWIVSSVFGLFLLKATIITLLSLAYRLPRNIAVETGLLLGQGGEFAFVVVGLAMNADILPSPTGQFMLIVTGLSMMATPMVAVAARKIADALERPDDSAVAAQEIGIDYEGHVIIAGFGRVGRMLMQVLEAEGIPFIALDRDAAQVAKDHAKGIPVFYGDASRLELLRRAHADRARALVITMDNPNAAEHVVRAVRKEWPLLPVLARAKDTAHAKRLLRAGASEVIPETVEASLQLAGRVLENIGVPEEVARRHVEAKRAWQVERLKS